MTHVLAQRQRTDRSFERLYRHHVLDVYRYALVVLHSPEDAEDVTQTTFLNAYRAYKDGERPRSVLNWLIAIALLFGRIESSTRPGTASFAFRFATRLPTCHTVHPRTALRLFISPIARAYPSEPSKNQGAAPRAAPCWREVGSGQRGGTGPEPPAWREMPAGAETYGVAGAGNDSSELGSRTSARERSAER